MRALALTLIVLAASPAQAAPRCSSEAIAQAKKLLAFHVEDDDRARVDPVAIERAPIRNPKNARQKFAVLEVNGSVYKGQYQMRLIYYRMGSECVLMGQEIIEHASL